MLSLPGVALFYGVMCGVGIITMYFIMPETEGRSLQDIELHFSNDSKRMTDWKISKSSNQSEMRSFATETIGNSKQHQIIYISKDI